MAKGCYPNGVVKKHSLYSRHPSACSRWGEGGKGRGGGGREEEGRRGGGGREEEGRRKGGGGEKEGMRRGRVRL